MLRLERAKETSGLPGKIVCLDLESGKLTDIQTVATVGSERKYPLSLGQFSKKNSCLKGGHGSTGL